MSPTAPQSEAPIAFKPATEIDQDPVADATKYVNHKWVQQLIQVRTECFYCHKTSPSIELPFDGIMPFGDARMRRRYPHRPDVTKEAVEAFAKIGWKFQHKRAYCPTCKGLGSA